MTTHHIEEMAKVWLKLNDAGTGWEIDSPSDDGYGLEGYDNGPLLDACECEDVEGCEAAGAAADKLPRPNLRELGAIIARYFADKGEPLTLEELATSGHVIQMTGRPPFQAACSCGWRSVIRPDNAELLVDTAGHLAEARSR